MKICQIPYVILESTVSFPSIFASTFSAIEQNFCSFLAKTYNLFKSSPLTCKSLRQSSARVKLRQMLLAILKRQVNLSSNFASFLIAMMHKCTVNFKLYFFKLNSFSTFDKRIPSFVNERIAHDLKNGIRNLVNFHASSQRSENMHFDWLVFSKTYKVLDDTKVIQCLNKNLLFVRLGI